MSTKSTELMQSGDSDYPYRLPADQFEIAIFKSLIKSQIAEKWQGQAVLDKNGEPIGKFGYFSFDSDPDIDPLINGFFEGFLKIDWPENADSLVWQHEKIHSTLPIKLAVIEREYPSSEAYRFEIVWEVDNCELANAEQNWLPYRPEIKPVPGRYVRS